MEGRVVRAVVMRGGRRRGITGQEGGEVILQQRWVDGVPNTGPGKTLTALTLAHVQQVVAEVEEVVFQ